MNEFSSKIQVIRKSFLIIVSLLCLAISMPALGLQYARPDATTNAGSFTVTGAPTHHEALNEATFSDSDFIVTSGNSTIIFSLSDITDPGSYASNHILRYRCQSTGGGSKERCAAALYEGNTLIAGSPTSNATRGSFGAFSYTVLNASTITDYTNLNVRLTASNLGNGETLQISWFELEVPDGVVIVAPTVDTPTFSSVTETTAILGGTVSDDGGAAVTDRGTVWGTSP